MTTRAIILGNGESRKDFDYRSNYSDAFVIGCNGAYKESVDALVCTDSYMQHLIYETGYCKNHLCFFSEWDPIPEFAVETIAASFNKPIIQNEKGSSTNAQVAGSEDYVYVTWVQENDMVRSIKEKIMSSGSRALELACKMDFDEILLLGFDGMGAQNIYQKDKGYERSTPREEWVEERKLIREQYSHINIIDLQTG
tara:strand:+ start:35 stop:625 length:591 start_codon:yes stop_codon:yes gene_type:complete